MQRNRWIKHLFTPKFEYMVDKYYDMCFPLTKDQFGACQWLVNTICTMFLHNTLRTLWAIIQFIGSPTSNTPICSWKSLKDHQTSPKIHFRGFRYFKRGPLQGVLDFMKILKKITKILNMAWNPQFWSEHQVSYHFGKLWSYPSQSHIAH